MRRLLPGRRIEVINAGVPGYRVIDNVVRLETELYQYRPDLIILYEVHNDLFTALPHDADERVEKETMAKTLMGYARANPDTIRGRPMPVIVYDPQTGRDAYSATLRKLRE